MKYLALTLTLLATGYRQGDEPYSLPTLPQELNRGRVP